MSDKKILMAMSGGVDSTAAVLLLQNEGWDVAGVTLDMGCNSDGTQRAADACRQLGIEHIVVECSADFEQKVITPFVEEYARGRTPSPCVGCNRDIKFHHMLHLADEMGVEHIATGHYARKIFHPERGEFVLAAAADRKKDQSYMLCLLKKEQLQRTVFPLADMEKSALRAMAQARGLNCASARDSQDVCFDGGNYKAFIEARGVEFVPGSFVDEQGRVLGRHTGLPGYTVGQRKGLGVSASQPLYVAGKDALSNTVTLVFADALLRSRVYISNVNWLVSELPRDGEKIAVKLRYTTAVTDAVLRHYESGAVIELAAPQRAPAPGQIAAIYSSDGEYVLGGGVIEKAE